MTQTTTRISTLRESIEELRTEDYDAVSGHVTKIYLDPERGTVHATQLDQNGWPARAHHNIDQCILVVEGNAIPSSVVSAVLVVEDEILALLGFYLGTEWDGSNHVGQWAEGAWDAMCALDTAIERQEITCYWDAGDWLAEGEDELIAALRSGQTPEEVAATVHLGDDHSGRVRLDDVISYLAGLPVDEDTDPMTHETRTFNNEEG